MAQAIGNNRYFVTEVDSQGDVVPSSGAKLYFYDEKTTTPRTVYADGDFTTSLTQPVVTDASGLSSQVFIDPSGGNFKLRVLNSSDVLVYEDDELSPGLTIPVTVANGGTGADNAADARTNLGVPSTSVTDSLSTSVTNLQAFVDDPKKYTFDAQTYASSFTPDYASTNAVSVTATGDITINAPANGTAGQIMKLKIVQDATGNRTIAFNSAWKLPGDFTVDNAFSNSPNAVDVITAQYVGASEVQVESIKREDPPYVDYDLGTYTTNTEFTQSHGLLSKPSKVITLVRCTSAEYGYEVGEDLVYTSALQPLTATEGLSTSINSTEVTVRTGAALEIQQANSGSDANITPANWKIVIRVYR